MVGTDIAMVKGEQVDDSVAQLLKIGTELDRMKSVDVKNERCPRRILARDIREIEVAPRKAGAMPYHGTPRL